MFALVPHPKLVRPLRGSPRMFTVDWIEKYASRVRPWHIVALWVPVCLWLFWRAASLPGATAWSIAGLATFGVLVWTFMEYTLHRFLFHFAPNESSELQRDVSFVIHGVHHDYPWDADRLVMPPALAAILALLMWLPIHALLGQHAFACFAGLIGGYLWYDLTHYFVHHGKPKSAYGKWLRSNHLIHHFSTPDRRYGITTPLWDFVFGTFPSAAPAQAREPRDEHPAA